MKIESERVSQAGGSPVDNGQALAEKIRAVLSMQKDSPEEGSAHRRMMDEEGDLRSLPQALRRLSRQEQGAWLRALVAQNDSRAMQMAMDAGVDVNAPISETGASALMMAIRLERAQIVQQLLPVCETRIRNSRGLTALDVACMAERPRLDWIRPLLPHEGQSAGGLPLLHWASASLSPEALDAILPQSDVFAQRDGKTALSLACASGGPKATRALAEEMKSRDCARAKAFAEFAAIAALDGVEKAREQSRLSGEKVPLFHCWTLGAVDALAGLDLLSERAEARLIEVSRAASSCAPIAVARQQRRERGLCAAEEPQKENGRALMGGFGEASTRNARVFSRHL